MNPRDIIDVSPPREVKENGKVVAVTREYKFRDGTVEVWRTAPGADPQTTGERIDSYVDKDQRAAWDKQQPTATSQATAGRQSQNRELGVNPRTNKPAWVITNFDGTIEYDENVPATVTGGVAATRPGTKTEPVTGPGGNTSMVTWELLPDGSKGRIIEEVPATAAQLAQIKGASGRKRTPVEGRPGIYRVTTVKTAGSSTDEDVSFEDEEGNPVPTPGSQPTTSNQKEPVPGFPGVYIVKAGTKDANGSTVSTTYYVNEAGERVQQPQKPEAPTMIGGKPHRLNPTTGNYEPIKVEGSGGATPITSDVTAKFGELSQELESFAGQLKQRVEATAGTDKPYTAEDMYRDLTARRAQLQMKLDETVTSLNAQGGIQNREIGEAQSRRSFANSGFSQSVQALQGAKSMSPTAGQDFDTSLKNMLATHKQYATDMGGFNTPGRTPLQNAIMNIQVNADGSFTFAPQGGAGGGPTMPSAQNVMGQLQQGMPEGGAPPSGMPGMGMGAGVGPGGESLTRPGFSEGQQAPEFSYDWRQPNDEGVALFDDDELMGDPDFMAAVQGVAG